MGCMMHVFKTRWHKLKGLQLTIIQITDYSLHIKYNLKHANTYTNAQTFHILLGMQHTQLISVVRGCTGDPAMEDVDDMS